MKKTVMFAVVAGLLFVAFGIEAQTKIRADGTSVVSNNRVDIAKEKAIDSALRNAVEKVVGVMVTSSSEVENFELKMDRILSESKGFINTYTVVSETQQGDRLDVVVEADVGRERLKDRMQAINLIMARKSKPRLMLLFADKAQKDAIAEAAMSRYFMGKGFKLIDARAFLKERSGELSQDPKALNRIAEQSSAEIVMLGSVDAETNTFNVGGIEMYKNKVTVTVKLINGDTGEVIATDSKDGAAPGMKGDIKKITEEAAEKLSRQIMEEVLEKWSAELTNTVTVKLVVSGLDSYEALQRFKDLLNTGVKGFREVQQRAYNQGQAELDVDIRGNSRSLADDLMAMTFDQKKITILAISANRVDAGFQAEKLKNVAVPVIPAVGTGAGDGTGTAGQ
jgi:hypothetical protein